MQRNVELGLFWVQALIVAAWQLDNWPLGIGVSILATVLIGAVPLLGYALAMGLAGLWAWLWYEPAGLPWALVIGGCTLLINLAAVLSARQGVQAASAARSPASGHPAAAVR